MKHFFAAPFKNYTIFPIITILKAPALHNSRFNYTLSLIFGLSVFFSCVYPVSLFAQDKNDTKQGRVLIIAAASDLNFAMPDIIKGFKSLNHGVEVKAIFGSSGNLASQIANSAPFDIFFSAGIKYIEELERGGILVPDSKILYGIGRIVLWVPNSSKIDIERSGIKSLLDPSIKRIAIANPVHAPYGKAAMEALERLGVAEAVKDKLILGENISQAAQFIQSGAADIGIIALSMALSPKMKSSGKYLLIPEETYNRIEQWVAIVKRSKEVPLDKVFIRYLQGEEGSRVLTEYGFIIPDKKGAR